MTCSSLRCYDPSLILLKFMGVLGNIPPGVRGEVHIRLVTYHKLKTQHTYLIDCTFQL